MRSSRLLFAARVHIDRLSGVDNAALATAALAEYDRCWRALPPAELHNTPLPGGWRSAANMRFFKEQQAHARASKYTEHIPGFDALPAFRDLTRRVRVAAASYLEAHEPPPGGAPIAALEVAQHAPLFCWASVHMDGSSHPPHVHSDSCVTGTYYARRPAAAAPLELEDPRGRSVHDVIVGIESRLRYGAAGGADERGTPPFDQPEVISPAEGDLVIFPPWLVHAVPGSTPDGELRVSFSFNLLGSWEKTVRPLP